jgi:hypothetical protein
MKLAAKITALKYGANKNLQLVRHLLGRKLDLKLPSLYHNELQKQH